MKKLFASLTAVCCLMMAGCSGEKDSGATGLADPTAAVGTSSEVSVTEKTEITTVTESVAEISVTTDESAEEESTAQTAEEAASEEEAADTNYSALVSAFGNIHLGLPSADRVYIFSDSGLSAEINGRTYYGVSCYDEYEGELYYMCDFYVAADGGEVYRRYEQEDKYVLLPEEEGYARLDPTRQTTDEIFEAANGLCMLFSPDTNSAVGGYDESSPTEINGAVYYPVTNELLDTKAKLMDALTKYFTTDIIISLMDTDKLTDVDGLLYVKECSGGTTSPNYSGTEYELTTLTEDTAVFTRYDTYNYEAGETKEIETEYTAKKENGVWRFTVFPIVW